MKIGITQLAQLTVQALDHQAKSLSRQFPHQSEGEALYLRIHAEAEKSRAALRLLMRDAQDDRASNAKNPQQQQETEHAVQQAQAALERTVRQYQPHRIAA
jgi:hypothetical protein